MKLLVTGASGQLGYDLIRVLQEEKVNYLATDRDKMDITKKAQVDKIINAYRPDFIIHSAAYTQVDQAEEEPELCYAINVLGTRNLVEAAKRAGAKLVYISTDYVFNGKKDYPYETSDEPDPINYYGQTKYQGELEVQKNLSQYFIVRTSWLFGLKGDNFVKTMLRLGQEEKELFLVDDQIGSPTYTYDLAKIIYELMQTEDYGIHHLANEGYTSWYDFALEIFKQAEMDVKVKPIKTEDYPRRAKRPKNSRLEKKIKLPAWENALERMDLKKI